MGDLINNWLTDTFTSILGFFVDLFGKVLGVISTNLDIIDTYYLIFVTLSSVVMITLILVRIVSSLLNESVENRSDAVVARIVLDVLKSCAALPIMLFVQGFLQNNIIFPLLNWLFSEQVNFSAASVTGTAMLVGIEISGILLILYIIFFVVVLGFFFFKMCQYYANMVFFTLSSPFIAITGVTEDFNMIQTWWRKLIYLNICLVAQVLSLTLVLWAASQPAISILYLMMIIGFGIMIIKPPAVLEDMWQSSGTLKKGMQGLSSGIRVAMMRR